MLGMFINLFAAFQGAQSSSTMRQNSTSTSDMTTDPRWCLDVINVLRFSALGQSYTSTMKWTTAGSNLWRYKAESSLAPGVAGNF